MEISTMDRSLVVTNRIWGELTGSVGGGAVDISWAHSSPGPHLTLSLLYRGWKREPHHGPSLFYPSICRLGPTTEDGSCPLAPQRFYRHGSTMAWWPSCTGASRGLSLPPVSSWSYWFRCLTMMRGTYARKLWGGTPQFCAKQQTRDSSHIWASYQLPICKEQVFFLHVYLKLGRSARPFISSRRPPGVGFCPSWEANPVPQALA